MRTDTTPDVLIAGAGPTGLLLANHLSRSVKVVIVEKEPIGRTSKYWITNSERVSRHGLEDCIRFQTPIGTVGTFLDDPVEVEGGFAVLAELDVLRALSRRARDQGVQIIDSCPVEAIRWAKGGIRIGTPHAQFKPRLFVDATGGGSRIAATFRLHKLHGFFTICGRHLAKVSRQTDALPIGHVLFLGQPPVIFEVAPLDEDSLICAVFTVTKRALHPDRLQLELDRHIEHNPFFNTTRFTELGERRFGVIPIGRPRSVNMPRVVGFGEAGLQQAPLLGGAFNEALVHAEGVSRQLVEALEQREALKARVRFPFKKRVNDWLQYKLVQSMVDGTVEDLQRFVKVLGTLRSDRRYSLLSSELGLGGIASVCLRALTTKKSRA